MTLSAPITKAIKSIFIIIAIIATFILGCIFKIYNPLNEAGIKGNSIPFTTPGFLISIINGRPDETKKSDLTGAVEYTYYNQKIFGENGTLYYNCLTGLNKVTAVIPVNKQNNEEPFYEKLFYDICDYICEVYSKKEGYYNKGITLNDNGLLCCEMGADFGAKGMNVEILCQEDSIRISASYQY